MKKVLVVSLALLLSAGLAIAAEQDKIGDDMVVTATRSEVNALNVPAKVEVINSQEIERTVGNTLTEQLKKNASIGVIEYPGALAGIGIRGFRPEFSGITKHSLILINGRPAGATNLATMLTDNVERVEILKGPASSLYGSEAMGGVVNVITKKNRNELTGNVEVGYGSFDTNFQNAAIGGGISERFDFDVTAGRYEQRDNFKMGNGKTRPNTSYQTQNGSVRVGFDLTDSWRIDLTGNLYQGRDIETPGDIGYEDQQSGHKDIDNSGLELVLGGKLSDNNTLSLTTYLTKETQESYKHYTGSYRRGTVAQVAPYRSYDSETEWKGVQVKDEYVCGAHKFIAGIDYQDIEKQARSYLSSGNRKAPSSPDETRENLAGYLESVLSFMDERLTVTAGGRYDTFDVATLKTPFKTDFTPKTESFSTFSPRVGLNYLLNQGVRLHTTVGKAFVPPTAWQLAAYSENESTGDITVGNENLDPESSVTYDIGIGYDKPNWGLSCDVTFFHTDIDDKISKVTVGNIKTFQNSFSAEMEGLEFMLSYDLGVSLDWDRSLSLFVNSTHIFKSEEEKSDGSTADIHNVADNTVNYGVQYDDGLIDGKLQVRYQGNMKDRDWTASGGPEIEYSSFSVVDLMIGTTISGTHRVVAKIDNLLDKDYYEKKGYNQPGRSFFVSYAYQF